MQIILLYHDTVYLDLHYHHLFSTIDSIIYSSMVFVVMNVTYVFRYINVLGFSVVLPVRLALASIRVLHLGLTPWFASSGSQMVVVQSGIWSEDVN